MLQSPDPLSLFVAAAGQLFSIDRLSLPDSRTFVVRSSLSPLVP
jgi:hypothetical protein